MTRIIKLHTENFEGETKQVGEVVIENVTIPVYEYHVNVKNFTKDLEVELKKVNEVLIGNNLVPVYGGSTPKPVKIILDSEGFSDQYNEAGRYGKGKYEKEFLDLAQKLRDNIEKEQPFALAFIYSDINRYFFYDVNFEGRGGDNPVKGFIQAWEYYGWAWLTWTQTPAVVEKIEKDKAFQTAFEKWALVRFLHLVFGDKFLPSPIPYYGSEGGGGFMNGTLDVGGLHAYFFSTKNGLVSNLPDYDEFLGFREVVSLDEKELELLYEVLKGKLNPQDFYIHGKKSCEL